MSADEERGSILREWIAKAENDLKTAAHTLELGERAPTDTICFHVQQCIEKYLKTILILRMIDFPKTHDLALLMKMVPESDRPNLDEDLQKRFTNFATFLRTRNLKWILLWRNHAKPSPPLAGSAGKFGGFCPERHFDV